MFVDASHRCGPARRARAGELATRLGVPTVAVYQTDLAAYASAYRFAAAEAYAWRRLGRIHNAAARTLAPSTAAATALQDHGVRRGRGVDTTTFDPAHRGAARRRALARIYASLDIFVHTGPYETIGQAVPEALASGVPVVAPAAGGPVDLVEPGRTGHLVPPHDAEAVRAAVGDELIDHYVAVRTGRSQIQRPGWVAGRDGRGRASRTGDRRVCRMSPPFPPL